MKYTPEQLAEVKTYNLKANAGEVGSQLLDLPNQLLFERHVDHPLDVLTGSADTRTEALTLITSALDVILAYAEDAGFGPDEVQQQLNELLLDRDSAWVAPLQDRAAFERHEAIFEGLTDRSDGRHLLEDVEGQLIEDGVLPNVYDEDGE